MSEVKTYFALSHSINLFFFAEHHAANYNYYVEDYIAFDGPVAALPIPEAGRGAEDAIAEDGGAQGGNEADDEGASKSRIRTEFPETWLWSDYVTE